MSRILIIGVGNPYRSDDGVGVAAIERLRQAGLIGVDLVEESGEPVALVQRWSGRSKVFLIDAVDSGGEPGRCTASSASAASGTPPRRRQRSARTGSAWPKP